MDISQEQKERIEKIIDGLKCPNFQMNNVKLTKVWYLN